MNSSDLSTLDLMLVPCLPTILNSQPQNHPTIFPIEDKEIEPETDDLLNYFGPNLWQPWLEFQPENCSPDPQILCKVKEALEDVTDVGYDSSINSLEDMERPDLQPFFPKPTSACYEEIEVPKLDLDSELFGHGVLYPVFSLDPDDLDLMKGCKLLRRANKILDDMFDIPGKMALLRVYPLEPCLVSRESTTYKANEMVNFIDVIEEPPGAPNFKALLNTLHPVEEKHGLIEEDGCKIIEQAATEMRQVFRQYLTGIRQDCQTVIRSILIDVIEKVPYNVESLAMDTSLMIQESTPPQSKTSNGLLGIGPRAFSDREQLARLTAEMQLESNPISRLETLEQKSSLGPRRNERTKSKHFKTIRSRSFVQLDALPSYANFPMVHAASKETKDQTEDEQDRQSALEHISGSSDSKEELQYSDMLSRSKWNMSPAGDLAQLKNIREPLSEQMSRTQKSPVQPGMDDLISFANFSSREVKPTMTTSTPIQLNRVIASNQRGWSSTIFQECAKSSGGSEANQARSRIVAREFSPLRGHAFPVFNASSEVPRPEFALPTPSASGSSQIVPVERELKAIDRRRPKKKIRSKLACLDPFWGL
ncbi:hypothetical protein TCAL_16363 [Tigriopus californicus]|uniref:Uncharacterized protein n=1 Tax=Tigriopus californicus TaxID=6832 RepID=A0A553NZ54_TIGCA|nr:uncharacterized protein LOC131886635 [Tigriopus californicus]TRY70711.1 hypothetical protein TCAL_16363 [Tigriopus californicus]